MYFTTNGSCTLIIGKLYIYETKPTYDIEWQLKLGAYSHVWTQFQSKLVQMNLNNLIIRDEKCFCRYYWNWNSLLFIFLRAQKECFKYDFLNVQKVIDILRVFEKKILWSVSCIQSSKKVPYPTSWKRGTLFLYIIECRYELIISIY